MGDGGFTSQEFEVQQQLGRLSWVQESPRESPLQAGRTIAPEQACTVLKSSGIQMLPQWALLWLPSSSLSCDVQVAIQALCMQTL